MNSLKTAVVVTVLLGVMYGVYTTLTNRPGGPPDGPGQWPTLSVPVPGGNSAAPGSRPPWASPNGVSSGNAPASALPSGPPPMDRKIDAPRFGSSTLKPPSSVEPPPEGPGSHPGFGGRTPPRRRDPGTADEQPRQSAEEVRNDRGPAEHEVRPGFVAMMESARKKLDAGELAEVHLQLSRGYGNPELTAEETRQLNDLLDQLAGTVIYSRQHLLEAPYVTKAGESLEQIAEKYQVPWQLLAKINGVREPGRLVPGTPLKVVRGPFEAVVSLHRFELALMLAGRYAGRFPIGLGQDVLSAAGTYRVQEKLPGRPFRGPQGEIPAGDPRNPLGRLWIGLSPDAASGRTATPAPTDPNAVRTNRGGGIALGIHGTDEPRNLRRTGNPGDICLGGRDLEDVYDILSCGSWVTIQQ